MKIIPVALICFLFNALFFIHPVQASAVVSKEERRLRQNNGIVEGQVIVKFKPTSRLGKIADQLFIQGYHFASMTGNSLLDEINIKYQVISYEKLYKDPRSAQDIVEKYPERAKRIPQDSIIPEINFTYIISYHSKSNYKLVCNDFEKSLDIEFCQPNKILTIQDQ